MKNPLSYIKRKGAALLLWSEKHTKTDMKYVISGGFWLALDEIAGGIAALGLAIAFAHFVPKDAYGTYRFLTALFWTLTAFTLSGLPTAVSRAVARGKDGAYRAAFKSSLLWSSPLFALSLAGGIYYFIKGNSELGIGMLIISALGPFMQSAYLWSAYFVGKKMFRELASWGAAFAVVPALCVLGTMFFTQSALALLTAYFAGTVATGLFIVVMTLTAYKPNHADDEEFRVLGKHFSAMNLLATIGQQVDKLVVFHYLGAVQLAVYSFAIALPEQIKNVFGGVSTLALPKFVERPFKEIRENFWMRLWVYTGLLAVVAGAYILVAPYVFKILFPQYMDAVLYSQLYALALIPISNLLPATLLQAHTAKRELYILNIASPVFQIGSLAVLTALYGITGAIIARIAARVFSLVLGNLLVMVYARRSEEKN